MEGTASSHRTSVLRASLNLLRRLDPADVSTHLSALSALLDTDASALSSLVVDRPSTRASDAACGGKAYLACAYNRGVHDSHRSPHSNTYSPGGREAGGGGEGSSLPPPSGGLRQLEVAANALLDSGYYPGDGALSSAYLWDAGVGFSSAWLIQQALCVGPTRAAQADVIHVFRVAPSSPAQPNTFLYTLTTSLLLSTREERRGEAPLGALDLHGTVTVRTTATCAVSPTEGHLVHMGTLLERSEEELGRRMDELLLRPHRRVVRALYGETRTGGDA